MDILTEVNIIKETQAPIIIIIIINSPSPGSDFGATAPTFIITVIDIHLDSLWYSLDGGLTTYVVTTNATIDFYIVIYIFILQIII